jgi:hypothetical protein
VSQVTFLVVLLFTFRKHERSAALRTHDFKVWHRGFSRRVKIEESLSMLFGALALRFFQPQSCGTKALFSQTLRRKALASRRLVGAECTPAVQSIQIFYETLREDCGGTSSQVLPMWPTRHTQFAETSFSARHIGCSRYVPKYQCSYKGPDI